MIGLPAIAGLSGAVAALGVAENYLHRRRLNRIPIRIHVNGTRGKSSVARLIAAALRESGCVTCAKTTGTLPRMILPDGSELPVFRPSSANVIEQIRIVSMAVECAAEALVIECMALQPRLQWLMESKFVRATHGVITNAREDHLEVMGPQERDVALALAGMTPRQGKLFIGLTRHRDVFEQAALDRKSEFRSVEQDDVAGVTAEELAAFSYNEHAENIALVLAVCGDLGIDRQTALRGMHLSTPDSGAMTEHHLDFFGRKIVFVNGFAANDPESTGGIWHQMVRRFGHVDRRIAIFNCRSDRPERSIQLANALATWTAPDKIALIGSGTYVFARYAARAGIDSSRFLFMENRPVHEVFEAIVSATGESALVMGLGNIGGPGLELVRYFSNRSSRSGKLITEAAPPKVTAPAAMGVL